jgi:hypothetical protein
LNTSIAVLLHQFDQIAIDVDHVIEAARAAIIRGEAVEQAALRVLRHAEQLFQPDAELLLLRGDVAAIGPLVVVQVLELGGELAAAGVEMQFPQPRLERLHAGTRRWGSW